MTDSPTQSMTEDDSNDTDDVAQPAENDHLEDVEDGCGCAEVWEHLSEQRENE